MPSKKHTRITLARSGGVAGIRPPPSVVDTAKLSPGQARRVEELLAAADFFTLPAELVERAPQPDSFQYSLTVENEEGQAHTVAFTEQSAEEPLRELKRLVRDFARS